MAEPSDTVDICGPSGAELFTRRRDRNASTDMSVITCALEENSSSSFGFSSWPGVPGMEASGVAVVEAAEEATSLRTSVLAKIVELSWVRMLDCSVVVVSDHSCPAMPVILIAYKTRRGKGLTSD